MMTNLIGVGALKILISLRKLYLMFKIANLIFN